MYDCGLLAPNDTAYKRWSCHKGHKLLCKLCQSFPPPTMGARFTVFLGQAGHADPLDCWRCSSQKRVTLRLIQVRQHHTDESGIVISAYKQITQISIRCNRIEHWVHLRCAGIRQAQYTDTWTCHLHR